MAKQQTDLKVVDRLGDEPLVLMGALMRCAERCT